MDAGFTHMVYTIRKLQADMSANKLYIGVMNAQGVHTELSV